MSDVILLIAAKHVVARREASPNHQVTSKLTAKGGPDGGDMAEGGHIIAWQ